MPGKVMIIAGEASGDLHGGRLVAALKQLDPAIELFGVGGQQMAAAGMQLYYHVDQLAYIGFVEVARHYFFFRRVFNHLLKVVEERKPDVVVLIDYPGFNLRFARAVKKRGVRTLYYIAPQVWAWGQGRAAKMAAFIDQMAVLFDFEVPFFSKFGIQTVFVGHPLLEGMQIDKGRLEFFRAYQLDPDVPALALLPGSRHQEVAQLLPVMLATAARLRRKFPAVQVLLSQASTIHRGQLEKLLTDYPWVKPIPGDYYAMLAYSRAALVASGTATLETACAGLPFALVYKVSPLSFAIGKRLVKIPYIGLVNIIAGEAIVHEYLQDCANPERLLPEVESLLFDEARRQQLIQQLSTVKRKLGAPGASHATAQLVLQQVKVHQTETI